EPPKPKKMIEKPVPKKIIRTMAPPRTRPVFQMPEKSLKERLQEKLNQQEHSTTFVEPQRVLSKTSANPRTVISTEGFTHQWYLDILRSKISVNWDTAALGTYTKKRIYADCSFVVKRDGTIKNIKIIKSSGYSQFDTSVVMAVEASTPIPPLPDQYYKDELLVNIRFELE
ncbi:MAG: TonB family protein, partial [Chlamydiota bacterium]|nr:TonB family protein [Chlamydiota bacterium]